MFNLQFPFDGGKGQRVGKARHVVLQLLQFLEVLAGQQIGSTGQRLSALDNRRSQTGNGARELLGALPAVRLGLAAQIVGDDRKGPPAERQGNLQVAHQPLCGLSKEDAFGLDGIVLDQGLGDLDPASPACDVAGSFLVGRLLAIHAERVASFQQVTVAPVRVGDDPTTDTAAGGAVAAAVYRRHHRVGRGSHDDLIKGQTVALELLQQSFGFGQARGLLVWLLVFRLWLWLLLDHNAAWLLLLRCWIFQCRSRVPAGRTER